jgi:hypothetical protein
MLAAIGARMPAASKTEMKEQSDVDPQSRPVQRRRDSYHAGDGR